MIMSLMAKPIIVNKTEEVEKEVDHNERVFSRLGLIGCFRGLWPSLGDLHKWISAHWEPILDGCVQIYPHSQGFFVVVFENEKDRDKLLCDCQWCWEDSRSLMLKPWHPAFNPLSKSFNQIPIRSRLPNLSIQFWFDSCFEAIGNSLGNFLITDESSLN
ncbi:hypothetical protein SUGI_0475970 [Cryptomeria japonica]|nr:hypothetical protein SUGI_0475970 [Cryptomeria japonica]